MDEQHMLLTSKYEELKRMAEAKVLYSFEAQIKLIEGLVRQGEKLDYGSCALQLLHKIDPIVKEARLVANQKGYNAGVKNRNPELAKVKQHYKSLVDDTLRDFSDIEREEGHPKSYWAGYHYARNLMLSAIEKPISAVKGTNQNSKVLKPKDTCSYCDNKASGAMLAMGNTMAHADCVIQKLNELLDPAYDGKSKRKPTEIVGYIKHRLDRPDREKIEADIVQLFKEADLRFVITDGDHEKYRTFLIEGLIKILALFDEEEIREQERLDIIKDLEGWSAQSTYHTAETINAVTRYLRQALKEGKKCTRLK